MQFGLGLLESLGLRRSLLLEVGLFRTQLGVELLQRLRPLYPIGPRGTRRIGVLLERVSLALEQRLLGLQRRLPGPSLLGRLRLLAPQSSPLFLEFFGAIREIGLPGFEVAPDLVRLRCFDFEGLLPTGQFAKAPGVFVRLGAVGFFVLLEGLFAGLELNLPGQDSLTPLAVRSIEIFLLLGQAKLTLADRLGLTVQVVSTSARLFVVLVLALLELSPIGLERPARFLEDHAVLVDRDFAAGQLLLAAVERLGSRCQLVRAGFQIGFLLVRDIRPLREA